MSVSEKATHRLARIPKYVSINKRIRGNVLPGSGATWAPVYVTYGGNNRTQMLRIPGPGRIENRTIDSACNPYLATAAILAAGLDGIENKIDPGEPLDKNIYSLGPEELANIPTLPHSLDEALQALEEDHTFMLKGDVFTQDVIDTWIDYKKENEVDPLRLRPHPLEFQMYYDC